MRLGAIRRWVVAGVLVGTMLPAVSAMAAQVDYFITFEGAKQGKIVENAEVTNVTHEPNMMAAMPMGKRMHSSLTITKKIDVASPKLFQAMTTGEALNNVMLTFRKAGGSGKAVQSVQLKNAMITNIRKAGDSEVITLSYDTVAVTWTNGGVTATDDWDAPK